MSYPISKRLFDIVLAITLLVIFLPVFLISIICIWFSMGRPVLFLHQRSGLNKEPFYLYKFRTMRESDDQGLSDQQRVTPLGLILRKYSIDELPQLINVILGQMSIIGPRPLLIEYDELYSEHQNTRFLMKPGITGLAQISGRNDLTWENKLRLDTLYVQEYSIWLDLKILARTPLVVLGAKGFKPTGEPEKFKAEK